MTEACTAQKQMKQMEQLDSMDPSNALRLPVGVSVNLELMSTGKRIWGEIVGRKDGRFILVMPRLTPGDKNLASESMIAVRYMGKEGQLCGFRTTVLRFMHTPCPLLFLYYPDQYETIDLRKNKRFDCFVPATVFVNGNNYGSVIINISRCGSKVVLQKNNETPNLRDICVDCEVFISFKSITSPDDMYIKSIVRNVKRKQENIIIGLEFKEFIGNTLQNLDKFLLKCKTICELQ
ncbi:PilZ domain-containing protein [Desulfovibrio inopinatus]|uniref:PilZ domain-containing protein n=1 Tax=Desulfovibrio inopinatus TaxID=102109 RepID=UPI0003FEDA9A|nr:PilZ domain-containing protein [Desulfovibrio inopinatus]